MSSGSQTLGRTAATFLAVKARTLVGRAEALRELSPEIVGLRSEDRPFMPSPAHFAAANRRLMAILRAVRARIAQLPQSVGPAISSDEALQSMAMVERELDRLRRAFGLFFETFAQRGTSFAPSLAAHDAIAQDCYAVIRAAAPRLFPGPLVPPLTYLEHGYSPATMRRGVTLTRLLGERNPFPLIRIPYDRDQPWQAVFLHEVAHNLQADLGLWVENKNAVIERLGEIGASALTISIFGRWHKEIFADLAALLLGGPAVAWGMAEFLAHPATKVMTYRPGGPHPTGYLRTLILARMLDQMGFPAEAKTLRGVWLRLYDVRRDHRIPKLLLKEAPRTISAIVDEIAFQPRRALAESTLAAVIPFSREDQARIRKAGTAMRHERPVGPLAPRQLVCAARYAIEAGADLTELRRSILARLAPASQPAGHVSSPALRPGARRVRLTVAA